MKIGHARISENGTTQGRAGDQNGKEVAVTDWYNGEWTHLIRCTDSAKAEIIARSMELACANDNIGYNWYGDSKTDRLSAYREWTKTKDIKKIGASNTDCSALVSLCCIASGIAIAPENTTRTLRENLLKTNQFKVLTDKGYLNGTSLLKRGDILLKEGSHVCVVLNNGQVDGTSIQTAQHKDNNLCGTYKTICDLHLRFGAGASLYDSIIVMPKGTKVANFGYYNDFDGVKWLCVIVIQNGRSYTGYCSSKYLQKD